MYSVYIVENVLSKEFEFLIIYVCDLIFESMESSINSKYLE